MATARQIAANQANSQKSTGPKTPEGKAKSSLNRLSHGLAASVSVIAGEDPAALKALFADLVAEHQPATATEQILVEQLALQQWLILRAFRLQGDSFLDQGLGGLRFSVSKDLGVLIRYQTASGRAFHQALNQLLKLKKQRLNSEIGFESQTFGTEVPEDAPIIESVPSEPSAPSPVTPISPVSAQNRPRPTFTDEELSFELCPEALEFFKKVG